MSGDVVEVFKIMNNMYDPEVSNLLILIRKFFFGHCIVNVWNNLPEETVPTLTMITFENRFNTFWSKQDIQFNFEATIETDTGAMAADQDLNIEVRPKGDHLPCYRQPMTDPMSPIT